MLVRKMNSEAYKKLIEYAASKFNMFSLNKRNNQFEYIRNKSIDICKIIFSDYNFTEHIIFNNYSENLINKICEKFRNNEKVCEIEKNYIKNIIIGKYHQRIEDIEEYMRNSIHFTIRYSLEMFMYDRSCEFFNKKYNNYNINNKTTDCITTYYFELNDESKNILFDKKSIYDWISPLSLEDLCLYKDDFMWLYSVAHENICDIACENKEEYEYLKSIGIEFYQDKYIE